MYESNEIILKLALQVITESKFIALEGDLKKLFKTLWHVENSSVILFCPALTDKDIFTDIKMFPKTAIEQINIMEKTLFETSFIYENIFYERQLISPFFIPYLEELLHFYKSLKIHYRLKKFIPLEHFEAVFTNKNFEIKEFGASDKVLIFEKNTNLIDSEITFLQKHANWAKIIYIIPHTSEYEESKTLCKYNNTQEIISFLKNNTFHFALIVGVDKSILSKPLVNQKQLTLEF